jgi:hypothetical protein
MKRAALILAATVAALVVSIHPAVASPTATCTEHVTPPYIDWGAPGTGDDLVVGTGFITCTGTYQFIEVDTRLIEDGVLLPVGVQTCSNDDYCQKLVYRNLTGNAPSCWKTRAWGYFSVNHTPTGATTSTSFCFP